MSKKENLEFMMQGLEYTELNFVTRENKIDTEKLKEIFDRILQDAEKSNKVNYHAARRFRVNSTNLSKAFLEMRKVSPVKKKNV